MRSRARSGIEAREIIIFINVFSLKFCHNPLRITYPRNVSFCVNYVRTLTKSDLSPILILMGLIGYGLAIDPSNGSHGIPCLWKLIFHHECLGCGLSRAGAYLVRGNIEQAMTTNWLILPVALLILVELMIRLIYKLKLSVR